MKVSYRLKEKDLFKYTLYMLFHYPDNRNFLLGITVVILLFMLIYNPNPYRILDWLLLSSILSLIIIWVRIKSLSKDINITGDLLIEIDENTIKETTAQRENTIKWEGIKCIKKDKHYIYIIINKREALVIPKRAFASQFEQENFLHFTHFYWKNAKKKVEAVA